VESGSVSIAVENGSGHQYLRGQNWHSHGKMGVEANIGKCYGEIEIWFLRVVLMALLVERGEKSRPTSRIG
jgi:hypothetical protein